MTAEPAPAPPPAPPPDPMKGIRGVFAMMLALEAIVVGLSLLVLPKFGGGATPLGLAVLATLALAMVLASGVQRRPWGLKVALVLQLVMIVAGFVFVVGLGVMGLVFALVWAILLVMRREVAARMARGELPSQQVR